VRRLPLPAIVPLVKELSRRMGGHAQRSSDFVAHLQQQQRQFYDHNTRQPVTNTPVKNLRISLEKGFTAIKYSLDYCF